MTDKREIVEGTIEALIVIFGISAMIAMIISLFGEDFEYWFYILVAAMIGVVIVILVMSWITGIKDKRKWQREEREHKERMGKQ